MRYIRFLKTPRLVYDKQDPEALAKAKVKCLVTITSDLGDSFFPHEIVLWAGLCPCELNSTPAILKKSKWTSGARYGLDIEIPVGTSQTARGQRPLQWPLRVYVGPGKAPVPQLYDDITSGRHCGILGAWSGPLDPENGRKEAGKLVERQVAIGEGRSLRIMEETGESIARHLWDAGFMLACHINRQVLNGNFWDRTAGVLQPPAGKKRLQVLELGTGCGMVGIGIAQVIQNADIVLTDLPEAEGIATMNLANSKSQFALNTDAIFCSLKWEDDLPFGLNQWSDYPPCTQLDLIVAADCTYNCDSSPALVQTMCNLIKASPQAKVMIAMKVRHEDEKVFFSLMAKAGFIQTHKQTDQFPGDGGDDDEMEVFEIYIYEYGQKDKKAEMEECEERLGSAAAQKVDRISTLETEYQSVLDRSRKRKR
ncbi:putative methyltransferase-domain-containing protein [Lophiotrema nucula]|uniref:Putative methyltransferase-domain-containing protein n=1 Tax=Lophiotrema nucula TaxID=690887 RepID=A0A6A5YQ45_9PLEO|nr:putative methyltransferase-domain-containing protein [Lophiotrema nucula]